MTRHCVSGSLRDRFERHFKGRLGESTLKKLTWGRHVRPAFLEAFGASLPLTRPERAELRIRWGERFLEAKTYEATDRERFLYDPRSLTSEDEDRQESYGQRKGSLYQNLFDTCRELGGGLIQKSAKDDLAAWQSGGEDLSHPSHDPMVE